MVNVISLKDYAVQKNISYEAVRQQVVRYKDELAGHLIRDGRQQFLDEEAVAFLDAKRQKNPVAIIQMDKDEQIEDLRMEREQLLHKIAEQANRISELAQWKADNAMLIVGAEQNRLALEAAEKDKKILEGFIQDAKEEIRVLGEEKAQEVARAAEASCRAEQAESERKQAAEALEKMRDEANMRIQQAEAELAAYKALPWYKKIFG